MLQDRVHFLRTAQKRVTSAQVTAVVVEADQRTCIDSLIMHAKSIVQFLLLGTAAITFRLAYDDRAPIRGGRVRVEARVRGSIGLPTDAAKHGDFLLHVRIIKVKTLRLLVRFYLLRGC